MRRFVALALAACSAPAPVTTHKVVPAPADVRDDDLARMPDNAWAVGAIDLVQLRSSLARRWAWQIAGEQSAFVARCRDELAAGTRATLALSGGDRDDTIYAIVRGIDRAAILRCAAGEPLARDVAPANVPCDGYDAAVHALAACPTPETQVAMLANAAGQLRSDGAAACPAAQKTVEAALARIGELGWSCQPSSERHHREQEHVALPGVVKDGAIHFGDSERVDFLDDHTLVIAQVSEWANQHAVAPLPAPARHPRWFESQAAAIDRTRGAWVVADVKKLVDQPVAVAVSGGIRGDLAVDLQIAHAPAKLTNEIFGIAQRVVDDKDFAGLKLALGCAPIATPARTPKLGACEAANQHLAAFTGNANLDVSGLLAERAARCVADNWPDDYVACVDKAADEHAFAACFNVLSTTDRERIERGTNDACGQRNFAVHLAFPDARMEALKLANASSRVERDCREPGDGELRAAFFDDGPTKLVEGCAGSCSAYDLATGHPAFGRQPIIAAACIGPLHRDAGGWTDSQLRCQGEQPDVPKDATAVSADRKRALAIARTTLTVWELPAKKALGTFALPAGCTTATFLGDLVAVGCGAKSYLASALGKRLAELGDVALTPMPLPDHTWALVARRGDRIDLYTGAGKKQTELAVPHHADVIDAQTDGAGTIAIVYGGTGPDGGAIAVIDAKQQLRVFQPPICPAPRADH